VADLLEAIEIETTAAPTASIIWMHGLGADGHDFVDIVPELGLPARPGVRFVFRAWYDIREDGDARREDPAGVRASQKSIEALIQREKERGVPASAIVLAGFSQGGAMALHTSLRHGERLAGVMALSCSLPLADTLAAEAAPANRDVPIFMAHGTHDPMIPMARALRARETLTGLGYRLEWHEYPMPHSVCLEEVRDISAWLGTVLPR
jgi:phospholipase/carboxylesterase